MTYASSTDVNFMESILGTQDEGKPKSARLISFSINKGTPKKPSKRDPKKLIQGDDLTTHFRLTPKDKEGLVHLPDGVQVTLGQFFTSLYGDRPGSAGNQMTVSVQNLDRVISANGTGIHRSVEIMNKFKLSIGSWAGYQARTVRSNRTTMIVCKLDPTGRWCLWDRVGLEKRYYALGEKPKEEIVVQNHPDLGDLYEQNGNRIALGADCYIYDDGNNTRKLCKFSFQGYLELSIREMENMFITGVGAFYTHSIRDAATITTSLIATAVRCAKVHVPLSMMYFNFYRQVEEINTPNFDGADNNSMSIQRRRLNPRTKKNGTVMLVLTQESNFLLAQAEQKQRQRILLQAGEEPLALLNSDLIGDKNGYAGTPMLSAPVKKEADVEMNSTSLAQNMVLADEPLEEDFAEAEYVEDVPEVETPTQGREWLSAIPDIVKVKQVLAQEKLSELFPTVWPEYHNVLFGATRERWGRTEEKRKKAFIIMCLYAEAKIRGETGGAVTMYIDHEYQKIA